MELRILDWFQTLHSPVTDQFWVAVTTLGNAGLIWIFLTAVLLLNKKKRESGLAAAAGLMIELILCNLILKNVVARIRPYEVKQTIELLIAKPIDYSFPSGHTAASVAFTVALYFAGEKKLWKECGVLAVLIAISRMYLYVHYPTDILGGLIVGTFCGWAGWKLSRYLIRACKKRRAEV